MTFNNNSSPLTTKAIKNEIVDYCLQNRYSEAEIKFQELLIAIDFPTLNFTMKKNPDNLNNIIENMNHVGYKISDFQKSIGSLTRYAPTPELATKYAAFCVREMPEPFTDELLEIILTINLIYVYNKTGKEQYKDHALKLIRKGVEYNFHKPRQPPKNKYSFTRSNTFKSPYTIFRQVSIPVLKYYRLKWSQDFESIIKFC